MNVISDGEDKFILISKQSHLDELLNRFSQKEFLAFQFKFSEREFFITLLKSLEIRYEDFTKKYFYYDEIRKLHISESGLAHTV